jgi:uncharacterized protein YdeI (YjbR/CyaY-like superfamily)
MERPDSPLSPTSRAQWRKWLSAHAADSPGAWLVVRKKGAGGRGVALHEAVEEAICFGWIDGKLVSRGRDSFFLRFSPRRPKSIWSRANKERAIRLMKAGRMEEAGLRAVREARRSGLWQRAYASAVALGIPRDLMAALKAAPPALAGFRKLPPGARNAYIWWILDAGRPQTRGNRIGRTVANSASGLKPGDAPGQPPRGKRPASP